MHAIEKILARHCGKDRVHAGEIINARVDFAEINDLYLQTVYSFYEMDGEKVWDKDKVAFVFDHYAPCPTIKTAQIHKEMRDFAKKNGLSHHFDTSSGVCHQVLTEAGLIKPGNIIIETDSHTTTLGAFGAFGTGCGATDMACIMITGEMWLRVPEIIEIRLDGTPNKGVFAKDVALNIMGRIKADGAIYKAIDFTGEYVESLSWSERMTICNLAVEMGAKTAYMQPNDSVLNYLSQKCGTDLHPETTDPDFEYAQRFVFDTGTMSSVVSYPGGVDNVHSLSDAANENISVDQGYIGSCTNGRLDDIECAFNILKGRHIPKYKRLVIVPASAEVYRQAISKGYIEELIKAGATIGTPGCAACLGTHMGVLAPNEVCISSTNRNFNGRMGSKDAKIYLASPATVAASILNGKITMPDQYL